MSPEFELSPREVHVWRVDIAHQTERCTSLGQLLSADETARASRFRSDADRTRYVVCRSVLRLLLGRYLGQDPTAVSLTYSPHGKPELVSGAGLQFNVSHSGNIALIALSRSRIGIDVEQIRPVRSLPDISARYFSESERDGILTAAPEEQLRAFFACWTKKEAYLKATGEGLIALTSPQKSGGWTFFTPLTPEDYIAAGVVEGPVDSVENRKVFTLERQYLSPGKLSRSCLG